MKQVTFANGTTLEVTDTLGNKVYTQGAYHDTIEFQFSTTEISYDDLRFITDDSRNLNKITITDETGTYLHENYTIRNSLTLKRVVVTPSTGVINEVTEERLCVTLAQLTYSERQQADQQTQIDALTLTVLGVA